MPSGTTRHGAGGAPAPPNLPTHTGSCGGAALALSYTKDLSAYSFDRLTKAVAVLLNRARDAGALRVELTPEEVFRALIGMCIVHDQPGWQATVIRLTDVFLDGMLTRRPEAPRDPEAGV